MVVRKVTVSLEESAYQAAVAAAEQAGLSLSAWLSRAADDRARVERGLRAVADYEREFGPLHPDAAAAADRALDAAGVGAPGGDAGAGDDPAGDGSVDGVPPGAGRAAAPALDAAS